MSAVPFELPLRAADAAALAGAILECAGNKPVRDDVRQRVAARVPALQMQSLRIFTGSLAADPIHPRAFFIAVDANAYGQSKSLLLRIAEAASPASALYPNSLLIGRMRAAVGLEVVVNAIPFGPEDWPQLQVFASQVDTAFLPRPLGTQPAFSVSTRQPASRLPGAFDAFRYLLRNRGMNLAVVAAPELTAQSLRDTYAAALWSAIRAGWRDGFALEAGPFEAEHAPLIADAAAYTTFIAPPELHDEIARVKAGKGTWKRFDPNPQIAQRTAALRALLDDPQAGDFAGIIREFV